MLRVENAEISKCTVLALGEMVVLTRSSFLPALA